MTVPTSTPSCTPKKSANWSVNPIPSNPTTGASPRSSPEYLAAKWERPLRTESSHRKWIKIPGPRGGVQRKARRPWFASVTSAFCDPLLRTTVNSTFVPGAPPRIDAETGLVIVHLLSVEFENHVVDMDARFCSPGAAGCNVTLTLTPESILQPERFAHRQG